MSILRDCFAGLAMMAIIAKRPAMTVQLLDMDEAEEDVIATARGAYFYADAMLRVRDGEE